VKKKLSNNRSKKQRFRLLRGRLSGYDVDDDKVIII